MSVCLAVCLSHEWAVQQRLNRSICCLRNEFMWVRKTCIRSGVRIFRGRHMSAHCQTCRWLCSVWVFGGDVMAVWLARAVVGLPGACCGRVHLLPQAVTGRAMRPRSKLLCILVTFATYWRGSSLIRVRLYVCQRDDIHKTTPNWRIRRILLAHVCRPLVRWTAFMLQHTIHTSASAI